MRIALGITLAAGLGIALLWRLYVSAPTPLEVCNHLILLVGRESPPEPSAGVQAVVERLRDRCVEEKALKIKYRGRIAWATYARCVVAAERFDVSERC